MNEKEHIDNHIEYGINIEKSMLFSMCALIDNKIYFVTSFGNYPMILDLGKLELSFLSDLEGYISFNSEEVINDDKCIYFFELNGNRMMTWDISNNRCSYCNIYCHGNDWNNYAVIAKYKNDIYIFPKYVMGIIKIHLGSNGIEKKVRLYSELNISTNSERYFECGYQFENEVWLYHRSKNIIVRYNLVLDSWCEYNLCINIKNCVDMIMYNNKLYLLSSEGSVFCWDPKLEFLEKIADYHNEDSSIYVFEKIIVIANKIFLFPSLGEDIVILYLDTKYMEIYKEYPKKFRYFNLGRSKYYGYCSDNEFCYFAMRSANFMMKIRKSDGKIYWIKPSPLNPLELLKTHKKYYGLLFDEPFFSIQTLLRYLNSNCLEQSIRTKLLSGDKIWEQIKRQEMC